MSVEKIIACIIGGIFQGLSTSYLLLVQNRKLTKSQKNLFIIILSLSNIVSGLFIPNQFRFIYSLTILLLTMFFIIQIKSEKIIIYSFNIIVILTFSEILITLLMVIFGINSAKIINNIFYNILANIFISIMAVALITIPQIKKIILKIDSFFKKNKTAIYYLYLFLIILYFISLKNGFELIFRRSYYINIVIIFSVLLLFFKIIINDIKANQLKEMNRQMMNYVTKYEKIITDQGKANHEFKNQLMVIRGYAQMNSPKLIEYLDSIVDDTKKTHSSYLISQLNRFPDGGIKGLLYYKLSIMDDNEIKYEICADESAKKKANNLSVEQLKNITKIIGVIIDNAIDAAKCSSKKIVSIFLTGERGKIIFNISNSFKGKLEKNKIGTGYTTKGKGHGYGLRLVKDIVNHNKYIKYEATENNNIYIVRLEINTSKNKK